MEPERIPKSFGCFPHRSLRTTLQRCKSLKSSSKSSPRSPNSTNITTTTRKTSATREEELKEVFRRFDGDSDGKISAVELRAYFASIGEYMSHEEARGVIEDLDADGDNLMDFGDFLRLMKKEGKGDGEGDDEDIKAAFEMFEFGKGSGRITSKSLQRVLSRFGDEKSQDECEAMIRAYDADGNGELDFHEFYQMMA